MKPVECCNLGHKRPEVCTQTLFGLNLENRDGVVLLHGELRKERNEQKKRN